MNVKFSYLYRDAGNYKNFGEVVFSNDKGLTIQEIQAVIFACLIEERWFVADRWSLPDLHFKEFDWDSELDHEWHEYEMLEETDQAATATEDISAFLLRVQKVKPV